MTENTKIFESVSAYYSAKIKKHGATANGVDWKDGESQELRFLQLLKVCDHALAKDTELRLSICDWGCGYGGLRDYLDSCGLSLDYMGYDWSADMISEASVRYPNDTFLSGLEEPESADFIVASGIFNVKLEQGEQSWKEYIRETIDKFNKKSRKGFAFNMLTSYSDADKMRPDLFYANPFEYFDYCKKNFSPRVALLHDYPLYEFTIVVRK